MCSLLICTTRIINLSDVTNKYYYSWPTWLNVNLVYEKNIRSLLFSGNLLWETRQASVSTGTVGSRVGGFLSPLNNNGVFYLSVSLGSVCNQSASDESQNRFFYLLLTLNSILNCSKPIIATFFFIPLPYPTACKHLPKLTYIEILMTHCQA